MFRDVFTGCKTLNKVAVKFPARRIVDVGYVSFRLVKPGAFDKTLQAVVFAIVVFNIDQESEAVPERNILHLRVIHLGDKGI